MWNVPCAPFLRPLSILLSAILLVMSTFFLCSLGFIIPAQAQEFTFQQAIQSTFNLNPKMKANEARIVAIQERTKAVWANLLGSLDFSISVNHSASQEKVGKIRYTNDSSSASSRVSVQIPIFDPAARAEANSAAASARAQIADFESSNSYGKNTKASLATSVMNVYSMILMAKEKRNFLANDLVVSLTKLLSMTRDKDYQMRIQSLIISVTTSLEDMKTEEATNASDFKFLVTLPQPERLQTFAQLIESLQIPLSASDAFATALERSHELQAANDRVEASGWSLRAASNRSGYPTANLRVDYSNSAATGGDLTTMRGLSASVIINQRFSFGKDHEEKAAAASHSATVSDRDDVLLTLEHDLTNYYQRLEGLLRSQVTYRDNFNTTKNNIDEALKQIGIREDKTKIELILSLFGTLSNQWEMLYSNNMSLLMTKFYVQKSIGTLF